MKPRPRLSARLSLFVAVALVCVSSLPRYGVAASAQDTVTGAFEGTVRDSQTGDPIARARLEFINQGTNVTAVRLSDSQGRFFQGLLPPGTYTIRATAAGYEPGETVQRLLATRTGEVVPVPINLDPAPAAVPTPTPAQGSATTPPTTPPAGTGAPPSTPAAGAATPQRTAADTDVRGALVTKDARRGGAFTEVEVERLPLGSTTLTRTFDELALFLYDVALPPQTLGGGSGPGVGAGVGTSGQFAVNGLRSRANNFTVDGSDNNDEDIGVRRQGFFSLVPQSIESVKEYQVITLLAPAQFGRNVGGQVNAISRSGGSRHHGTLYGIFNSSQLNARNFFDSARGSAATPLFASSQPVVITPAVAFNQTTLNFDAVGGSQVVVRNGSNGEDSFTLGQGGFVLGGPLVKDKLFYFVSVEGQRLNATKEASFIVPTVAQRGAFGTGATGISTDPFTGMRTFAFPLANEGVGNGGAAVFSLFPFPNDPGGVYGENTFTQELPASARGRIVSGKIDYNFRIGGRPQSITERYNFTDDYRFLPVTGGALSSTLKPRVRTQNSSFFFNSELSGPDASTLVFNQLRLSYGRTRLNFDEVRDPLTQIPSQEFPDVPFLLNAPLLANFTLPNYDRVNDRFVPNTGPVLYLRSGFTVEDFLGPVGQVIVAGFSPIGVDVFNFPQKRVNNTYQFADQLTIRRGNHAFIFGTDNRRTELNSILPRNFRPLITFYGAPRLAVENGQLNITNNFVQPVDLAAASAASGFFQTLTTGSDSGINLRFYQYNFYGQDEWRVLPNLSISYGLRYEYNTVPGESGRRIEGTFNDPLMNNVPGLNTFVGGRRRIFEPDRNNLSPRLGIAYSPNLFGRPGTTMIRVGYGHYNDIVLGTIISQSRNVFPTFVTANTAGGAANLFFSGNASFSLFNPARNADFVQPGTLNRVNPQTGVANLVNLINCFASAGGSNCPFGGAPFLPSASGVEATLPARQQETPGAHQYAFSVEQRFGTDFVVSAAYVGTQGHNLIRFTTPNLGTNAVSLLQRFGAESSGQSRFSPQFFGIAVAPGTRITNNRFAGGRPVPGVGGIQFFESTASSRYDAMQLQVRGRVLSTLQFRAGYTLSEAVDDVSDVFDLAGAPALPQNSLTFEGERAPANFDARHRFSYHFVYDVPRLDNRALDFVFRNMQLAGAGQYQTGQPFTVNSIFDVNLDGNLTDRLDTTDGIVVTGDRRQPLVLTTDDLASLRAPVGQDGAVGRNTFRAGSILDMNLAVTKTFRLDDQQSFVFRTEVFNFINRDNFGVPVRFLEAPGFGQATQTVTPGRRIQFQLKYSF